MNDKNRQPKQHNPMRFNTSTEHTKFEGETNDGPSLVETAGYIPLNMQLARLQAAGASLLKYREENYDFPSGIPVPDDAEDPTRAPNYDMADASMVLREVEARLTERKRKRKLREKLEAEETSEKEPNFNEPDPVDIAEKE